LHLHIQSRINIVVVISAEPCSEDIVNLVEDTPTSGTAVEYPI